ncbi:MAG: ribosome biogenesis GTP-binding protein YihA/YsxC [Acidobacteria bacterium]|nr:ribosome biogenesis GTP-binding protein YihA/YsxC [Acidobacteriota bacterium]
MKITSAEFIKSAFDRSHWLDDPRPEIAFLGRSNVGKSSLINSLLGRRGLARTSSSPGRTQSINFFLINGELYFADLPGYGYAKVSKAMRADWGKMAEDYLRDREQLALCVHLVDSRHEPTALDRQLNEWLVANERPFVVAATKADKLSANGLAKSLKAIKKTFAGAEIIAFSAETGRGRDELWATILRAAAEF